MSPTRDLIFLTGLNLLNYLDRSVLSSVIPPMKRDLHLSDTEVGWLTSAFMIGYFVSAPFFGHLADRGSRRALLALGVATWSVGSILSGLCGDGVTLLACRVLVGFGEASYATIAPAWLSDLYPAERRNQALTIFYVAIPVGSALGYLLGGSALGHGGWRAGFLWAGAPGLLLAMLVLRLREPKRGLFDPGVVGPDETPAALRRIATLVRIPDYTLTVLGYAAYTFVLGGYAAWGPTFLNRVHRFDLAAADRFFGGVLVIGGLFGTVIGGFASTAVQRRWRSGHAGLLTLSVLLALPFAILSFLTDQPGVAMASLATAIFLAFLPTGPINTLLLNAVPPAARATAMALSIFAIHLFGDFWSPAIIGFIADSGYRPDDPTMALRRAMLILPAVLCVAALAWGWLAWRQQRRPSGR